MRYVWFGSSFNTNTTIKFSPQVFFGFTMHRGPTRLSDRGACSMSRADSESHTARPGREHHGMSLHTIGPSAAGTRHRSKDVHISSRTANATMIAPSTTCDTCQLERAAGTSDPPRCSKSAGLCAVHRASPLIPRGPVAPISTPVMAGSCDVSPSPLAAHATFRTHTRQLGTSASSSFARWSR